MSEKMNHLIQDIARKHGVLVGEDDPILMLQTVNEQLIEDNKKAHEEMLLNFKGQLETISAQWRDDAKEKAEKILNAALNSSKEVMAKLTQQSTEQAVVAVQTIMNHTVTELKNIERRTKSYSRMALMAAGVVLFSLLFVAAFSYC